MREYEIIEIPARIEPEEDPSYRQLRVAAYCRVSTSLEAQQNSFQAQKDYYTDLIASNSAWTLAGLFTDEGITGTSASKRPGFQNMIRRCEQGKIDLVITKSISRFARNTLDCLYYVRYLQELGIPILFETEGIDTSKMDNELLLTILGATSQAESEATRNRVKWGVREGFRKGQVRYYYKRWLGYRKGADGKPEIVPEEAVIVRKIFSAYLDGFSIRDIKNMLESEQIPTKNGRVDWSTATIEYILQNEKYTGDALLQKTYTTDPISKKVKKNDGQLPMYIVKGCHEPIISHEIFDLAHQERKKRSNMEDTVKSKKLSIPAVTYSSKYALSSILVCGECNTLYRRCVWNMPKGTRIVWRCRSRLQYGRKYCKNSPTIDEAPLHRALVKAINKQLCRPEYLFAPFQKGQHKFQTESTVPPAQSMEELYCNLLEFQRQIDVEVVELIARCADEKEQSIALDQFRQLIEQRRQYETYIETLHLERQEESYANLKTDFNIPVYLTEYNDTIARLVLDNVKVLDQERLLVIFKGGVQVEQTIEKDEG